MSDSSQLAKGCWRKKAGKYFLQCILVIDLVAAADDHGDWQPDKKRQIVKPLLASTST